LLTASSVTRPDKSLSTASKAASNFSNVCFSIPTLPPPGIATPAETLARPLCGTPSPKRLRMSAPGASRPLSTLHGRAIPSCGFTIVILQQPTEPCAASEGPFRMRHVIGCGRKDHITFPLVGTFLMKMGDVFGQNMLESTLPKQDEPREGFFFD